MKMLLLVLELMKEERRWVIMDEEGRRGSRYEGRSVGVEVVA
jgi:hypothetical protein